MTFLQRRLPEQDTLPFSICGSRRGNVIWSRQLIPKGISQRSVQSRANICPGHIYIDYVDWNGSVPARGDAFPQRRTGQVFCCTVGSALYTSSTRSQSHISAAPPATVRGISRTGLGQARGQLHPIGWCLPENLHRTMFTTKMHIFHLIQKREAD